MRLRLGGRPSLQSRPGRRGRRPPLEAGAWRPRRAICASSGNRNAQEAGGEDDEESMLFSVTAKEVAGKGKLRMDTYLAAQLPETSRARVAASIRAGLVRLNGAACAKPAAALRAGDRLAARLLPPEPCTAEPEAIALDVVYEDDDLMVVNKPAGMVVHISPGHSRGTLVNALLGHCGLPAMDVASGAGGRGLLADGGGGAAGGGADDDPLDDDGDDDDDGDGGGGGGGGGGADAARRASGSAASSSAAGAGAAAAGPAPPPPLLRPGIVHRLDRGTTGLMVVAKRDAAHARLCEQFKARTVSRTYWSVTLGVPRPGEGGSERVDGGGGRTATNIDRDPANRLRMAALALGAARGRAAASRWRVLEELAGGGAALVEWKLETGRTHQIRVHARHLGHPLLGDDLYGGTVAAAAAALAGRRAGAAPAARALAERFAARPALHALTLGFDHPRTGERLEFSSELPDDLAALLGELRAAAAAAPSAELRP